MFICLLFLLIDRIQVKMQLGSPGEPQIELLPLDHNLPFPREIILGHQHHFLIEFDPGRHLHLVLIAGRNLEMLLLARQHYFIFDIFLLILIDDQTQILSRYFVPEVYGLIVLDGYAEIHVIAIKLDVEKCILKFILRITQIDLIFCFRCSLLIRDRAVT